MTPRALPHPTLRSAAVAALGCVLLLLGVRPLVAQRGSPEPVRPGWTRGATCYEVFVRSFADSDGDGIGDLRGLTGRLDYLNDGDPATHDDLGVRCLWLMPVAESPSYHGYDVRDYYRVEPDYGSAEDFRRLVAEAHRRGIAVLVDMVLNHSSREHPHFLEALRDPASPYRSWYRFSPRPLGSGPWGEPAWRRSPLRDEYYYGVFSPDMPDLDYDTPAVRAEAERIADYWVREMGVDGFRLDAVPYLVERGDTLAGSGATHDVLRGYAAHLAALKPDAWTVGEVWDSTGAILAYYPDQLSAYFTFALSDSLLAAVRTGRASALLPGFLRMQAALPGWRWAPFQRNHDQTRTVTALAGDPARARLAAVLLLTLPGLPFVYYGEEIGMTGDKPDPRLRTPMQWRPVPGAGFTSGTPWEPLQPDSLTANVAVEAADPGSLLNLYRRLIRLRAEDPALGDGLLVPLAASDPRVAAYLRRDGARAVLVVANLAGVPLRGVTLRSEAGALPAGRYRARALLGRLGATDLVAGAGGRISGYAPAAAVGAGEALVVELHPIR